VSAVLSPGSWLEVADRGRVYRPDLTFGGEPWLRGHWADRLAAIDADLGDMRAESERLGDGEVAPATPLSELDPHGPDVICTHTPPPPFVAGEPVGLVLSLVGEPDSTQVAVHYRHLN
jgi:hypothetical protein